MPVIPALWKLRKEDIESKASWAVQQVTGQTGLHNETLAQKN
jgi:hypothetical protein